MTPAEIETLLTGQHVKLYPYVRGYFPPETLYTLWHLMRAQGAIGKLFYGRLPSAEAPPHRLCGDLVHFVKFFEPEEPNARPLLLVQSQKQPEDIAGMVWFDDMIPEHRAAGSVFYRRKYWGEPAREATRLAIAWAFAVLKVESCWAYTPWKTGRRHAQAVGMNLVATLPGYVVVDTTPTDLDIYRITREEFG